MAEGTLAQVLAGDAQWCIIGGDSRELLAALPVSCVDVCIADPPYSEHTHSKQWIGAALTNDKAPRVKTAHAGLGFDALDSVTRELVAQHLSRTVKRWSLVFSDLEGASAWTVDFEASGHDYVRTCIWDKIDSAPQFTGDRPAAAAEAIVCAHRTGKKRWNGGGRRNVFHHAVNGQRGAKPHPSTKPIPLMLELVELFTDPGEVILDCFCGSGSTGVAALRLGRRFIGFERQEKWLTVSTENLRAEEQMSSLAQRAAGQEALFR
jgi:DNA modification methylase